MQGSDKEAKTDTLGAFGGTVTRGAVSKLKFRAVKTPPALSREAGGGHIVIWLMIVFLTRVGKESFKDGALCCHNR